MVFNSLEYAIFLPAVLVLYWRLGRVGQNRLIVAASWAFYAFFDWRFLGLLLISTGLDFYCGRVLGAASTKKKRWLIASVAVNLGILAGFKYFNFFIGSGTRLLHDVGLNLDPPVLRVVLPIGISFYTFHGISYVFDVYRGALRPTENLLDYACFVAFFPQLVAGPIGRATIQLPQFEKERVRPGSELVTSALGLILLGLVKKVVIADSVALVANTAFGDPRHAGSATLLLGVYAFAVQIYCDFSGYSDIARGSARLLGIELPRNFTQPYLSRNATEFWQRWHISLSRWLRDYLYVPLGGNRGGSSKTYRNLMVVMLLGGLWHGASWTFVVWGGAHGLWLALHRAWTGDRPPAPDGGLAIGKRLFTFHTVALIWILFRAANFMDARQYFGGLLALRAGPTSADDVLTTVAALLAVLALDLGQRHITGERFQRVVERAGVIEVAVAVSVVAIVLFSGGTPVPFIYFRF